jgi:arylsulfatase A-like enzyme
MKISTTLSFIMLLVSVTVSRAQEPKVNTTRPNILFIVIDDASWVLSPPNMPSYLSLPGFDSIRLNGAMIKSTFCNYALCNPSRTTFLTSLYAHQNGAVNNLTAPYPQFRFFTQALHDAGYHVDVCGKFTNAILQYQKWAEKNRWMAIKNIDYKNPTMYFTSPKAQTVTGYTTSIIGDTANKWLAAIDTPFCFWEGVIVPHTPTTPLPSSKGIFDNDYKKLTKFSPFTKDYPSFTYTDTTKFYYPYDSAGAQLQIQKNYECYVDIDATFTKQLNTLKARGLLDNTLIFLIDDNGYQNGEHLLSGKQRPYQESLGLPCYIRYKPWFSPGTVLDSFMFQAIDVGPTILDAANVKDSAFIKQQMGKSLRARIRQGKADSILYDETIRLAVELRTPTDPPSFRGVRTFSFNYAKYQCDSSTEELFDLNKDPGETQNVARNSTYKKALNRFRFLLDSLSIATSDTIKGDTFYQPCKLISTAIEPRIFAMHPSSTPVSISPNPVNSTLVIRADDGDADAEIKTESICVYSSIGDMIVQPKKILHGLDQTSLNVRTLADGIYFLRVTINGEDQVLPFVVQHDE